MFEIIDLAKIVQSYLYKRYNILFLLVYYFDKSFIINHPQNCKNSRPSKTASIIFLLKITFWFIKVFIACVKILNL